MKLSQSNLDLQSPDCYLVHSYLIATVPNYLKIPLSCPCNEAAQCTAALLAHCVPAAQLALLFIFGISWRTTTGRLALAIQKEKEDLVEEKRRKILREEALTEHAAAKVIVYKSYCELSL